MRLDLSEVLILASSSFPGYQYFKAIFLEANEFVCSKCSLAENGQVLEAILYHSTLPMHYHKDCTYGLLSYFSRSNKCHTNQTWGEVHTALKDGEALNVSVASRIRV